MTEHPFGDPATDPLALFVAWKQEHPDRGVPADAVTDCGFGLGRWVQRMRAAHADGTLPTERARELEAAGFTWSGQEDRARGRTIRSARRFEEMIEALAEYRAEVGDVVVPQSYVDPEGRRLGAWVSRTQGSWRRGELSAERIDCLHQLGLRPTQKETLQAGLDQLTLRKIG